ncbi:glycosyltransferase [Serratia oryzae]|uniref:Glycosyl transferase n=1 Tax=Serratia oryzae TaxID=2034155 RepID=A0A1S8CL29_9GAMM|nr:glycosyltransferase [Serratia oryzae]OMQ23059.1 glycosyl transferase [Serratia oryzae]
MLNNDYKVAVIMSVYRLDELKHIELAINSILHQTQPCSIFIYQDGPVSPDVSGLLLSIAQDNKNVTLLCSEKNNGLAHALNAMIDCVLSKGYDYIARMDSDDISHLNRIERQVNYLEKNPDIDILGTFCREFGATYALKEKHLPTTHDELVNFSVTRCPFIHPTVMFKSTVFSKGVRYPTNTCLTEDMALWFLLVEQGFKFSNLDEVLLDFRLNENSIKRRKGLSKAISEFKIRARYMFISKKFSLKNLLFISLKFFLHLLPLSLLKLMYKYAR